METSAWTLTYYGCDTENRYETLCTFKFDSKEELLLSIPGIYDQFQIPGKEGRYFQKWDRIDEIFWDEDLREIGRRVKLVVLGKEPLYGFARYLEEESGKAERATKNPHLKEGTDQADQDMEVEKIQRTLQESLEKKEKEIQKIIGEIQNRRRELEEGKKIFRTLVGMLRAAKEAQKISQDLEKRSQDNLREIMEEFREVMGEIQDKFPNNEN